MTRAKRPEEKKKPGRKPWYHDSDGSRVAFLRSFLDEWKKCKEAKSTTLFYNSITVKYVLRFDNESTSGDPSNSDFIAPPATAAPSPVPDSLLASQGNGSSETMSDPGANIEPGCASGLTGDSNGSALVITPNDNPAAIVTSIIPPSSHTDQDKTLSTDSTLPTTVSVTSNEISSHTVGTTPTALSGTAMDVPDSSLALAVDEFDKGLDNKSFSSAAKDLGWIDLSNDELKKKRAWFKGRRDKISEWYRVEFRAVQSARSSHSIIDKVFKAEPKAERKPVRVADYLVFMDLYYDTYIKTETEKELKAKEEEYAKWKEDGCADPEIKPPVPIAIRGSVARVILSRQTKEFQDEIKKEADDRYAKDLRAWEGTGDESGQKSSPQDHAKEISRWGPEVAKFNTAVAEANNMIAMMVLVGPNPFKNGQIDSFWSYAGPTHMGLRWPQDDRPAYEAVKKSLINFGRKVFTPADRAARALPAGRHTEPSTWDELEEPTTNTSPAVTSNDARSAPSQRKSHRPGPGRNSQNMTKPAQEQPTSRPKPRLKKKNQLDPNAPEETSPSVPQVAPAPVGSNPTAITSTSPSVPQPDVPTTMPIMGDPTPTPFVPQSGVPTAMPIMGDPIPTAAVPQPDVPTATPVMGNLILSPTTPNGLTTFPSIPQPSLMGDLTPTTPSSHPTTTPMGDPTPVPTADVATASDTTTLANQGLSDTSEPPSQPLVLDDPTPTTPSSPPTTTPMGDPTPGPTGDVATASDMTTLVDQVLSDTSSDRPSQPLAFDDSTTSQQPLYSPALVQTATQKNEDPTVWTHPDFDRFWPEMQQFLTEWLSELRENGWESEDWVDVLEDLLEVFIEYEGEFRYTEDNGDIRSKFESAVFKDWVKVGRPAILRIVPKRGQTPEDLMEKLVSNLTKWWHDVVPVHEGGENEDWAPLDCVSGRNGVWKVICFMVFSGFFICGQVGTDLRGVQLAAWINLARGMTDILIKVIRWGCQPPKKRKAIMIPEDQPSAKRRTRLQVAQEKEADKEKERNKKGGFKGSKNGRN
ncbi:hypothetical protein K435DRAFT_973382 [Dendrothele bispora CBS 962.96]|uniref:Uncharacterized protein n=1 Tax=Dendrothele bispora (strain CBS 962.96) TaxID=1314807 RepID=A0A4S8KSM7_DENBC|nr:hypothetical protein K435DRAFT_973382 [Dendrothele bispora CBS 962.96]